MKVDDLFSEANLARTMRDAGINTAARHADEQSPRWVDRATELLTEYARQHRVINSERVRGYAASRGLPHPPDGRAWGAVMQRAARAGWIRKTGRYETAEDPKVHCNPVAVWESLL